MAKKTPAKKPASKTPAKKSGAAAPKAKAPAKSAAKAKAPTKAPAKAAAASKESKKSAPKAAEAASATKPSRSKKAAASEAVTKSAVSAKGAKKGAAIAEPKKVASEPAAAKAPAKGASKDAKAGTAGSKAATTKSSTTKAAGGSKRASAKSFDAANAKMQGQAFLSEPGPRFRSPFSSSASTAKAAAARMAEAAGLTAIRAASVQRAPTLKKFKKITETPLPEKQLEEFQTMLIEKRDQVVGDVSSMEKEALGGDGGSLSRLPQHMADQGTDTYDQSLNLDLAASQRGIVKEIDAALSRIANRTYGVCELLGKPIGIDRLRNAPWTRYSIEAARMLELNPELARVGSGASDDGDDDDADNEV